MTESRIRCLLVDDEVLARLARLEAELDPGHFLRIHRGTLVNLERIREVHPLFYGDCQVVLRDGTRLTLSRRFRGRARTALGLP